MLATISAIYRYPVKGLSAEKLESAALTPGECLPHDRRFAIALGSTLFDPQHPEWLSKIHFIMLMRDEKLAQLQTRFDAESGVLTIAEDGRELLRGRLAEPTGRRLVAEFYANFLGAAVKGPLRVVEAPGHAFADARRKAECDERQIRLADQPRQHRGARSGDGGSDRPDPLSRECLFRRSAGLVRTRLDRR